MEFDVNQSFDRVGRSKARSVCWWRFICQSCWKLEDSKSSKDFQRISKNCLETLLLFHVRLARGVTGELAVETGWKMSSHRAFIEKLFRNMYKAKSRPKFFSQKLWTVQCDPMSLNFFWNFPGKRIGSFRFLNPANFARVTLE